MTTILLLTLTLGGLVYSAFVLTAFIGVVRLRGNRKGLGAPTAHPPKASIILAARNEEAYITATLNSLLAQNYPDYEIIVADDRSSDNTATIVASYARSHTQIRLVTQTVIPPGWSPKKAALMKAIEASTGSIIVATDADCRHHPDWLHSLITAIPPSGGMAIGQARFDIGTNPPLWQRVQSLDFTSQEILSAGLAASGSPFNCSGASIAYSRRSFDQVNGWAGVEYFISGDDELLMAKFVQAGIPVVAVVTPASVVQTRPPETLRAVWRQRVRWGSKTLHYAWSRKATLSGIFVFYLMLTLTPVFAFVGIPFLPFVAAFLVKLLLDGMLLTTGGRLFGDRLHPLAFIVAELLHPPVIVAMAIAGAFGTVQWKDTDLSQPATSAK